MHTTKIPEFLLIEDYTYTNNWPPDRRVGNVASTETYFYFIAGVLALFIVLGLFVFCIHRYGFWYGEAKGLRGNLWFWLGHQGWEFLESGFFLF